MGSYEYENDVEDKGSIGHKDIIEGKGQYGKEDQEGYGNEYNEGNRENGDGESEEDEVDNNDLILHALQASALPTVVRQPVQGILPYCLLQPSRHQPWLLRTDTLPLPLHPDIPHNQQHLP